MTALNFHKPLTLAPDVNTYGHKYKVVPYNADGNRVVWVDDMVFPIDDTGKAIATVDYPDFVVENGEQLVVNAPEKKVTDAKRNLAVFGKFSDGNWEIWGIYSQNYVGHAVRTAKDTYKAVKVIKITD